MAEYKDPGTPENNLSWRNGTSEGRGSQSSRNSGRSIVFAQGRNHPSESESWRSHELWDDRRTIFTIPERQVGRLIGRQGYRIQGLQDATDTYIHIDRGDNAEEAMVFISGTPKAQRMCKDMVLRLLQEQPESDRQETEEAAQPDENKNEEKVVVVDWDAIRKKSEEQERQKLENLPRFRKYFYVEAGEIADMCDEDVQELRSSLNNITVSFPFGGSGKIPNPVETFEQAYAFYPKLLTRLKENFRVPFPIQCQGWPILLTGHDMIGIAQTGTGKTLAFLLPALIHIDGQDPPLSERDGPNVLILAPTRELALQIDGEVKKFPYYGIRSTCIYGGVGRDEQIKELQEGVHMVIGTPGRINDFYMTGVLKLSTITFVVLDEADRMLDLGFEYQIRKILLFVRPDRQTVMTSATWPRSIQNLAERYMKEPIRVSIGSRYLTPVHSVNQSVHILKEEEKYNRLLEIIEAMSPRDKMIVFASKRTTVDSISSDLALEGIESQSIHGNRDQNDREQALEEFRNGDVRILVATDVASRGLDIEDVTKVLNFDFPRNMEEYVHRVGRTGRAGRTGEAITFFTKEDEAQATELVTILDEAGQIIPDDLREISSEYERHMTARRPEHHRRGGRRYRH